MSNIPLNKSFNQDYVRVLFWNCRVCYHWIIFIYCQKIGTSTGVVVGLRSGSRLTTTIVDLYFHDFYRIHFMARRSFFVFFIFFATAPTVSAVAKDPHFFSFVGPLSDWSGQTLLFSYWSTQTECSTHACSSQQSCVAHCAHLSADGLTT